MKSSAIKCLISAYRSSFHNKFRDPYHTMTSEIEGKHHLKPFHQKPLGILVYNTMGHNSKCLKYIKIREGFCSLHISCQMWSGLKEVRLGKNPFSKKKHPIKTKRPHLLFTLKTLGVGSVVGLNFCSTVKRDDTIFCYTCCCHADWRCGCYSYSTPR